MIKVLSLTFCFCIITMTIFSQSSKGIITGRLMDSTGKEPISLATVAVYQVRDSSLITYRLSDPNGLFKVPGLPLNDSIRIIISFVGSRTYRLNILLTEMNPQFAFDTITIHPDLQSLDEILVMAEIPPIIVRNDTIEFNANSFKTLPSALVEDLLRKLPGVDVDGQGNITVNGRKVNKLYVDGKEFFGSDPQMATKNLPANIIDKVQVTDDKEQLRMNPDLPKGQVGQIINLKLKKAIKKGWFGKAYAGAGTDSRHETGGIFNLFRDTLQVSLLGYTNNINKPGFGMGDVMNMGGFQRSGTNSIMVRSDGGFALNNISFGGTGNGIQRSTGAGINLNNQLKKNLTLNFQYFYGQIKSDVSSLRNTQQFFSDTTMAIRNTSNGESGNYSHRLGGYVKWKIDSTSDFEFRPSLTFNRDKGQQLVDYKTSNNHLGMLNESNNIQNDNNKGLEFSQEISYYKSFKKNGRSLYTGATLTLSGDNNERENNAENIFYDNGQGIESLLNQLRKRSLDNHSINASINYNEPLGKSFTLRVGESLNIFNNRDNVNTFLDNNNDKHYTTPDPSLTNGFKRRGFKSTSSLSLKFSHKKWSVSPGINYQVLDINNSFEKNPSIEQRFNYFLPSLSIYIGGWMINYNVSASEPSVDALQPVENNTNPLYIQKGNPSLKPSVSHSLSLYNYKYLTKSNFNYNLNIVGSMQNDAVIYARTIDKEGVQVTTPVNADGSWYAQASGSINKQFKFHNDWKLSTGARLWATFNRNLILLNQHQSTSQNWWLNPSANFSFNWKDVFEFRQDFGLNWRKSTYSNDIFPAIQSTAYNTTSEIIIRTPNHFVWETSIDYRHNPEVAQGFQKDVVKWNAAVNFLFLKEDRAQLKLSVFDLLNKNKQVYRNISENLIEDNETMVLQRYFMLTFTYNFRKFGGKVGGRERFFLF